MRFEFVNQFYVTDCVKGFTEVDVDGEDCNTLWKEDCNREFRSLDFDWNCTVFKETEL